MLGGKLNKQVGEIIETPETDIIYEYKINENYSPLLGK